LSDNVAASLKELRGYGESFCLVSQSPSEVNPVALRTCTVIISHAIQEGQDRARLRKAMALTEVQSTALSSLRKGEAVVCVQGRSPYQIQFPLHPLFA
jgi:hypothetical protein